MIFRKFRFILLAFCFFLSSLRAETDVDALLGAHQDTVARITGKLPVWNWGWGVQLLAAVLIGLFGLAVSMMKEEEDSNGTASPGAARAKRLRVALGISIGVLTLLSSILVDTDYREFGKAVARAELAMERLGAERRTLEGGSDLRGYRALAKIPSRNKKQESDMQQLEEALAKPMDTMKGYVDELTSIETSLNTPFNRLLARFIVRAADVPQAYGESNDPWQAEENAVNAATELMVNDLVRAAGLKGTELERSRLRELVAKYGERRLSPGRASDPKRSRIVAQFSLNPSYQSPKFVGSYVQAASRRPTRGVVERVPEFRAQFKGKVGDIGYLEASSTVGLGPSSVRLQAPNRSDGSFVLGFSSVLQKDGRASVKLEWIQTYQDSSAGSTRWTFVVMHGTQQILTVPEQRWDDTRNPTESWLDQRAFPPGRADVAEGRIALTVIGIKPKVL